MNNHGFTLIELVISVTVILIISAFAVPGVINYQRFQTEEQFVNQAVNELRTSQLNSIALDDFSNFRITENTLRICKGIVFNDCKELTNDQGMFPSALNTSVINNIYYFDRFANTNKNTTQIIDTNDIDFETENFRIMITKHGGVYKEKK